MPILPAGSLLVLSDRRDIVKGDAVALSPVDGSLLVSIPTPGTLPFAATGDMTASGIFAVTKEINPSSQVEAVQFYNTAVTLVAAISILTLTGSASTSPDAPLKSDGTNLFYLAIASAPSVVYALDRTGILQGTWTLPAGAPTGAARWIAVTRTGSILYFTKTGVANGIHAYDLVHSVALLDFVTAGPTEFFEDLATLPNGDVLVLMQTNAATDSYQVQRYTSAGMLQATYPIGNAQLYELPVLFLNYADPTAFWVKAFPDATGHTATYFNIVIADGSVRHTFVVTQLEGGGVVPSTCPELLVPGVPTPTGCPETLSVLPVVGSAGCATQV